MKIIESLRNIKIFDKNPPPPTPRDHGKPPDVTPDPCTIDPNAVACNNGDHGKGMPTKALPNCNGAIHGEPDYCKTNEPNSTDTPEATVTPTSPVISPEPTPSETPSLTVTPPHGSETPRVTFTPEPSFTITPRGQASRTPEPETTKFPQSGAINNGNSPDLSIGLVVTTLAVGGIAAFFERRNRGMHDGRSLAEEFKIRNS